MANKITFHGEYTEDESDIALEDFLDMLSCDDDESQIVAIFGYGCFAPDDPELRDNNLRLITGNAPRHEKERRCHHQPRRRSRRPRKH